MQPTTSDERQCLASYAGDLEDAAAQLDAAAAKKESDVDPTRFMHQEIVQVPELSKHLRALARTALQLAAGAHASPAEAAQKAARARHKERPKEVDTSLDDIDDGRGELARIDLGKSANAIAIQDLMTETAAVQGKIAFAVGRLL